MDTEVLITLNLTDPSDLSQLSRSALQTTRTLTEGCQDEKSQLNGRFPAISYPLSLEISTVRAMAGAKVYRDNLWQDAPGSSLAAGHVSHSLPRLVRAEPSAPARNAGLPIPKRVDTMARQAQVIHLRGHQREDMARLHGTHGGRRLGGGGGTTTTASILPASPAGGSNYVELPTQNLYEAEQHGGDWGSGRRHRLYPTVSSARGQWRQRHDPRNSRRGWRTRETWEQSSVGDSNSRADIETAGGESRGPEGHAASIDDMRSAHRGGTRNDFTSSRWRQQRSGHVDAVEVFVAAAVAGGVLEVQREPLVNLDEVFTTTARAPKRTRPNKGGAASGSQRRSTPRAAARHHEYRRQQCQKLHGRTGKPSPGPHGRGAGRRRPV